MNGTWSVLYRTVVIITVSCFIVSLSAEPNKQLIVAIEIEPSLDKSLILRLVLEEEKFCLHVQPSAVFVDENFLLVDRFSNHSSILRSGDKEDSVCYYSGWASINVTNEQGRTSANICRGLYGFVKFRSRLILIKTLKLYEGVIGHHSFNGSRVELHIIQHLTYKIHRNTESSWKAEDKQWNIPYLGRPVRAKRANMYRSEKSLTVELAVFVDVLLQQQMNSLYAQHTTEEITRFVMALVSAMEVLFDDATIGHSIRFVLKRLELIEESVAPFQHSTNINTMLTGFCEWQYSINPPSDQHPLHWDHAVLLTGVDLITNDAAQQHNRRVVGYAPVGGMCSAKSSCTVNEGKSFESIYIVAHEIGHSLGMQHDGQDNFCNRFDHIMSATLGTGKNTWSKCSRRYLDNFIEKSQARCLFDSTPPSGGDIIKKTYPGERIGADEQCRLQYGLESRRDSDQSAAEMCANLHCQYGHNRFTSHPALEGTSCGHNRWCRRGKCVPRHVQPNRVISPPSDGGWSEWSRFSPCASSCLRDSNLDLDSGSSGVQIRYRRCDNPFPSERGKQCSGASQNYRLCNATQQCRRTGAFTVNEYATRICRKAAKMNSQLSGIGISRATYDSRTACRVWCVGNNGTLEKHTQSFPDGVSCSLAHLSSGEHDSGFCVSGLCEKFDCHDNSQYLPDASKCHVQ